MAQNSNAVQVLVEALKHTYNPGTVYTSISKTLNVNIRRTICIHIDKATRQAAEAHLAAAQQQEGYLVLLLQVKTTKTLVHCVSVCKRTVGAD